MSAKCPKCEKLLTYTKYEAMEARGAATYKGVVYKCPYCSTAIGFQMDPVALINDTVRAIGAAR